MPNELKPLIRHCKNCQWAKVWFNAVSEDVSCKVRYKIVSNNQQRAKALFCRYYKKNAKEGADND